MDYRILFLLLVSLISASIIAAAYAETTGSLNFNTKNESITTGVYGYTVSTCTSNSDCFDYKCFLDYDSVGSRTTSSGLCNATSVASCIHDDSDSVLKIVAGDSYICVTNTTYRQCSSGSWGSSQNCASDQTCSVGNVSTSTPCAASSGSGTGSGSGSGGGSNTTAAVAGIDITSFLAAMEIVQGNFSSTNITVKNTGNITLTNITLSTQGIDSSWFAFSPAQITSLSKGNSGIFKINFSIPGSAEVKNYTVTFTVTAKDGTKNSLVITLKVLPSANTTLLINQTYENYTASYGEAEGNIAGLEQTPDVNKEDLQNLKSILDNIKSKLAQANDSISKGDYFNAKLLLDEAKGLIDTFNQKRAEVRYDTLSPPGTTPEIAADQSMILIIAGAVIIVLAIIAYLFWPTRKKMPDLSIFRK